jgi:hypothetical protein
MRLHHGCGITAALLATAVSASPPPHLRRSGDGYDGLDIALTCQGTQTLYTTTTVTMWDNGEVAGSEQTGLSVGADGQRPDYGVGASASASATKIVGSSWSYGLNGAAGSESGSSSSDNSGSWSSGSESGSSNGNGGYSNSGSGSGSGSGSNGSNGYGNSGGEDSGFGGIPKSLLKPSIKATATYGPGWVVVNGDVHDYSEQGTGPWGPPGYDPEHGDAESTPSSKVGSGYSRSSAAASPSMSSGYGSGLGSGGYYPSHGSNNTASATKSSAAGSHTVSSHVHPSSASTKSAVSSASQSSSSAQPSQSGSCTPCAGNTASTRDQWCQYDINTNYYSTVPCTGQTREYFFELTEHMASPDGWPRLVQSINGKFTF